MDMYIHLYRHSHIQGGAFSLLEKGQHRKLGWKKNKPYPNCSISSPSTISSPQAKLQLSFLCMHEHHEHFGVWWPSPPCTTKSSLRKVIAECCPWLSQHCVASADTALYVLVSAAAADFYKTNPNKENNPPFIFWCEFACHNWESV